MNLLVNIDVDDLEKAILFYTEALGLQVARRFGTYGVEMLGNSAPVYLLLKAAGTAASRSMPQQRTYDRHWTPVHLDFVVEDVESAVKKAVFAGATLEDPVETHKWGRIAHLADPFGHGFCLLQFVGQGYDALVQ